MTIPQLINKFDNYLFVQKQRSKHTVKNYISDINQCFSIINLKTINGFTNDHVDQYIHQLNTLNLNPKTIHRKLCAMSHFFDFLIDQDIVQSNPWKGLRKPRIKSNVPNYLEESAILELLDNYPTENNEQIRNKAILELLFSTGIRVTECVQLKISNINFDLLECRIIGKGDKERTTLFGNRCKHWLLHYLDEVYPQWCSNSTDSSLFISKNGAQITQRTIQRIVKHSNQFHSSSIEITPHVCRHSCASMLLTNGANIRDIQDILGHSSIITTQRYANIPTKKLKERFFKAMQD